MQRLQKLRLLINQIEHQQESVGKNLEGKQKVLEQKRKQSMIRQKELKQKEAQRQQQLQDKANNIEINLQNHDKKVQLVKQKAFERKKMKFNQRIGNKQEERIRHCYNYVRDQQTHKQQQLELKFNETQARYDRHKEQIEQKSNYFKEKLTNQQDKHQQIYEPLCQQYEDFQYATARNINNAFRKAEYICHDQAEKRQLSRAKLYGNNFHRIRQQIDEENRLIDEEIAQFNERQYQKGYITTIQ